MAKRKSKALVVVSDLHCGCRMGLCPPEGTVDFMDGGPVSPSAFQTKIWAYWQEWWNKYVPQFTNGQTYDIAINGDLVDGRHHNSTTMMSSNLLDQHRIAVACLAPIADRCRKQGGRVFVLSGTPAHAGEQGVDDEMVAESIGAVKSDEGRYARYELWYDLSGRLVHITHHISATCSAAYETTALMRELVNAYVEAGRWGDRAPNVIVRGHAHRNAQAVLPSESGKDIGVVTPGWQGKTPYIYKIQARMQQPQFGGVVILVDSDGEPYVRHKVWRLDRGRVE